MAKYHECLKCHEDDVVKRNITKEEDAHTYAMTSWRNYETSKLWKILQEVDWSKLKHWIKSVFYSERVVLWDDMYEDVRTEEEFFEEYVITHL